MPYQSMIIPVQMFRYNYFFDKNNNNNNNNPHRNGSHRIVGFFSVQIT